MTYNEGPVNGYVDDEPIPKPEFDPIVHISMRKDSLTKDIDYGHLNLPKNVKLFKILHGKAFPMFTDSCCRIIRQELFDYHLRTGSSVGPTLRDSKDVVPFTYKALTHPQVTLAISSIAGFDLDICFEVFEVSQFADIYTDIRDTNLLNCRKYPYTFIFLMQLDQRSALPTGMATILEGKFTTNISALQIANQRNPPSHALNLIMVLKPSDIVDFENKQVLSKVRFNNLLRITYQDSAAEYIGSNDNGEKLQDILKYASWLDDHYEKLLSN